MTIHVWIVALLWSVFAPVVLRAIADRYQERAREDTRARVLRAIAQGTSPAQTAPAGEA